MRKTGLITLLFFVIPCAMAQEQARKPDTEAKVLSGMSVMGNNEAPKSLYIVPWKGSEAGMETELNSGLLDDSLAPVDKEVFMRQLNFYEISKTD